MYFCQLVWGGEGDLGDVVCLWMIGTAVFVTSPSPVANPLRDNIFSFNFLY